MGGESSEVLRCKGVPRGLRSDRDPFVCRFFDAAKVVPGRAHSVAPTIVAIVVLAISGGGLSRAALYTSFPPDLPAWTITSHGGIHTPPAATSDADSLFLSEGDGFLLYISQPFLTDPDLEALVFTYALDPGFDEVDVGFADALEVHLVDPGGAPLMDPWRAGESAYVSIQQDGTAHAGPAVTVESGVVTADLTHLPSGIPARLVFTLIGADAGTTSAVRILDVGFGFTTQPPVANAGPDQTLDCGDLADLDGSLSSDPDGDPLFYVWRDVNGTLRSTTSTWTAEGLRAGDHTYSLRGQAT